jgi:hypothetical protein
MGPKVELGRDHRRERRPTFRPPMVALLLLLSVLMVGLGSPPPGGLARGPIPATGTSELPLAHRGSATMYSVTFDETGLPSGAPWSVELTNATHRSMVQNSTGPTLEFLEPNGTFVYAAYAAQGQPTRWINGTVRVDGTSTSVELPWGTASAPTSASGASSLAPLAVEGTVVVVIAAIAVIAAFSAGARRRERWEADDDLVPDRRPSPVPDRPPKGSSRSPTAAPDDADPLRHML